MATVVLRSFSCRITGEVLPYLSEVPSLLQQLIPTVAWSTESNGLVHTYLQLFGVLGSVCTSTWLYILDRHPVTFQVSRAAIPRQLKFRLGGCIAENTSADEIQFWILGWFERRISAELLELFAGLRDPGLFSVFRHQR